jgi:hypothetical protein
MRVGRGGVAEWLKAADCKSARVSVRWFESSPLHQPVWISLLLDWWWLREPKNRAVLRHFGSANLTCSLETPNKPAFSGRLTAVSLEAHFQTAIHLLEP